MSIEPCLATSVQISAFIRLAEAQGDFATLLRKGDPVSGAILIVALVRGANAKIYERYPSLDGPPSWQALATLTLESEAQIREYLEKRTARDPDLWVIELDTADDERLAGLLGKQA
ncbi:DUF1491 family protein [Sphingorhabdus arenilitoris]|uniref:DUF1491 family protein n=1 Tax=Sphingorhabdus arenilitoris TaxID=1490041 RepID=A0ABV8RF46_9SPHN